MFLAGHPSQGCFGLQSHCAPCYFFNQASFYPSDFSFIFEDLNLLLKRFGAHTQIKMADGDFKKGGLVWARMKKDPPSRPDCHLSEKREIVEQMMLTTMEQHSLHPLPRK
ncbi:hypothetical protein TNCV_4445851 [Trichonephila clavipes]|nr:hypothetical protein TNCV_4445851 [Trichonephila clavipes]